MDTGAVVKAAQELVTSGRPFMLVTVDQSHAPQARWMGGNVLDQPFTVWMASRKNTRKMDQVRANPAAQLVCSNEDLMRTATISGRCEIVDDREAKVRLWEGTPGLSRVMSGPDDPNFGVLKFTAHRVELLDLTQAMAPQVAEL
jgi:general stress protein 26